MMADILCIPTLYTKFKFAIMFWSFAIPSIPVEGEGSTGVLSGTLVALSAFHIPCWFSANVTSSAWEPKPFFSGRQTAKWTKILTKLLGISSSKKSVEVPHLKSISFLHTVWLQHSKNKRQKATAYFGCSWLCESFPLHSFTAKWKKKKTKKQYLKAWLTW